MAVNSPLIRDPECQIHSPFLVFQHLTLRHILHAALKLDKLEALEEIAH